jgi:dolichol-phosphate mannosyltransferase
MYSNCGLKVDHINYKPLNSDASLMQKLKNPHDTALTVLILFTNVAYKVSLTFTFIMMIVLFGGVCYTVVMYLKGNSVAGYTTIMLLVSGSFFALFAILAVVIKYLSIILGLIFSKQRYLIESIEKVTG